MTFIRRSIYDAACRVVVAAALVLGMQSSARGADANLQSETIRVAVLTDLVSDVNDNDVRAALSVWFESLARRAGLHVTTSILQSKPQLVEGLRDSKFDVIIVSTLEYPDVARYLDPNTMLFDKLIAETGGAKYLLVVPIDSPIQNLAQLKGHDLLLYREGKGSLGRLWLEGMLKSSGLGTVDTFFRKTTPQTKVSRALLPVYFKQADACLVTEQGFRSAAELNPQLAAKSRIIATSPALVTGFGALHRNFTSDVRRKFLDAMSVIHATPEGQQALTLFHTRGLIVRDLSILRPTLTFLKGVQN